MLKWISISVVLIVADIMVTIELLSLLEPNIFVTLYLSTTSVGVLLLYSKRADFKVSCKANKILKEAFEERVNGLFKKTTAKDLEDLKPMLLAGIYMTALIFIAIPGLVTDFMGILLTTSFVSNWLASRQIEKALA
ncbi:MAG: FxsA family protein [Psychromonas sp.]|nr:FxsA family protein [Psychromonas sp.]